MIDRFLTSAETHSFAAVIDRFFLKLDYYVIWIILILLLLTLVAYLFKQVTIGGAISAFSISLIVVFAFGFGGLSLFLFYILSAIFLYNLNNKNEIYEEVLDIQGRKNRINFLDLFSKGIIIFVLSFIYLINPSNLVIFLFGVSLSQVSSDLYSTELGVFSRGKTVSILNGSPIKPGLSGGISFEGTLSAIVGAFLVSLLWYSIYLVPSIKSISFIAIMTLSGFTGCIIDSLLGITVQASFFDENDNIFVEKEIRDGKKIPLVKGIRFINNNKVDFISNLFSIAFAAFFYVVII
jgi:uncharacterized protein (TIGR00297 family)